MRLEAELEHRDFSLHFGMVLLVGENPRVVGVSPTEMNLPSYGHLSLDQ